MKEKFYQKDKSSGGPISSIRFKLWKYVGAPVFGSCPLNFFRVLLLKFFGMKFAGNCHISRKAIIIHPHLVSIGRDSSIDFLTIINGRFRIGNNVSIASGCVLCNGGHNIQSRKFTYECGDNEIGSGSFVGMGAFILKANVGVGSVVGANSFVTKDIPDNSVAYGNPASVKGMRLPLDEFERYTFD